MFKTKVINDFYKAEINHFQKIYNNLHKMQFQNAKVNLALIENNVKLLNLRNEPVLNDVYLLNQILSFHSSLIGMWEEIYSEKYSISWNKLQDCLDKLRNVNKFCLNNSKIKTLIFFEKQLLVLEKLYPYKIFFSMGMEVALYECSICGKNIDSFDCEHDMGELYRGEVAFGIAKDITNINHISMVENPMNKRCVVQYKDESQHFRALQFLNSQLTLNKITPITLYDIDETPRKKLNKDFVKVKRNEKCFCGSGQKFKKCCVNKQYLEEQHIELIVHHEFKLW